MRLEYSSNPLHSQQFGTNPFLAELMPANLGQAGQPIESPVMLASLSRRPEDLWNEPYLALRPNSFEQQREVRRQQWNEAMTHGRWAQARDILNTDLGLVEQRFGANSPQLRETLSGLATCELRLGNPQRACDLLERCLGLFDPSLPSRFQCDVRANLALCHLALAAAGQRNGGDADEIQRHRTRAVQVLNEGITNIGSMAQTPSHARLLEMMGTAEMAIAENAPERRGRTYYRDARAHIQQAIDIMENHGPPTRLLPLLAHYVQACLGANAANPRVDQLQLALPAYRRIVEIGDANQAKLSQEDRGFNYYNLAFALGNIAGSLGGIEGTNMFREAADAFANAVRLLANSTGAQARQLRLAAVQNYIYCAERGPMPPTEAHQTELRQMRQLLQQLQGQNQNQ
jgi:tetratricopeptide (TPR) repeat protein